MSRKYSSNACQISELKWTEGVFDGNLWMFVNREIGKQLSEPVYGLEATDFIHRISRETFLNED